MAKNKLHPGLTTILLLLMAWLAMTNAATFEKFLRQHVDYPMTEAPDPQRYCKLMMKRRHLATSRHCKHINTFVHTEVPQIQAVCGPAGEPTTGDLRESDTSFPLTVCKLQRGSWAPDCNYVGTSAVDRIIIACEDGNPVHLETEVPDYLKLEKF
ncbi:ribonuclease-like [Python bivittatus]|uniref:Ribonuclease-like n=1 Tax=Python bivittatus TaxID=176946 RepID=A0A9F5MXT2_PYTBI|nr:ribonuclease-like [Python bivittatus]